MKKLTTLLSAFLLTAVAFAQNFEIVTKRPVAGSALTIEYMPRNTVLQGIKDFEATAYLLEGKSPIAQEIKLKQEGGIFRGTVKTTPDTRAVFFSFSKDELRDNNNDNGYYTVLYDKSGKEIAGANLALASAFSNYGFWWELKRNLEKASELNKKEFENTAARSKFYNEYFLFLRQSKDEGDKTLLKTELAKQADKKELSEDDLQQLKANYEKGFKDQEKADAITAQIKERFPNGNWKKSEAITAFSKAKSLPEKEARFSELMTANITFTKDDQPLLDNLAGQLARMNADSGNYDAMKKYLDKIVTPSSKANTLNTIAWKMAGEGLNKKPKDVKKGLELSALALSLIKGEQKTLTNKPVYLTDKQYVRNLENTYFNFSDTYATLLYHNGDHDQAYAVQKSVVEGFKRKDISSNETFAVLTEKVKGAPAAQNELEKFFTDGKYTQPMKEQLQRIYTAAGNNEAQWTSYVTNLEEMAYNKLKEELAKKMINLPAPQFALKDMSGKQVSLASLRGKVVVVDFWATWCGPCIASFPGMQKTVNKFKDNPDVVFLFIDTWENDSNRVQKVTDFIAKNKYTFNVLYDEAKAKEGNDFVVVENFKVDGIPTKFVIDKNNNIRFKSVGYSGSADATINELTAMIDMASSESGVPVKKGF